MDVLHGRESTTRGWVLVVVSVAAVFAIQSAAVALPGTPLASSLGLGSHRWLTASTVSNVARIVFVCVILFGIGRFRLRDAGLRTERLLPGIAIIVAIWGLTQVGLATHDVVSQGTLRLYGGWKLDPFATVATFLHELGSDALFEELFWRGFVLIWLTVELTRRFKHPIPGAFFGMIISQGLFALGHIPERLSVGIPWGQMPIDFLLLTLTGIYYSFLYLRTDNLFIPMGVHALAVWPVPLFDSSGNAAKLTILLAAAFLFIPTRPRESKSPIPILERESDSDDPPVNPSPS